jgi:hypothetical protein
VKPAWNSLKDARIRLTRMTKSCSNSQYVLLFQPKDYHFGSAAVTREGHPEPSSLPARTPLTSELNPTSSALRRASFDRTRPTQMMSGIPRLCCQAWGPMGQWWIARAQFRLLRSSARTATRSYPLAISSIARLAVRPQGSPPMPAKFIHRRFGDNLSLLLRQLRPLAHSPLDF